MYASGDIGGKAARLVRLREAGFPIPAFTALSGEQVSRAAHDRTWDALANGAIAEVVADAYAVRSSGSSEDSAEGSLAGAFTTEIPIPTAEVASAMRRVAEDALKKLGTLEGFGIIVQAFVEPELAGVTFTRHPFGGRETVIEWHAGRGDALVSGRVVPQRLAYMRNGVSPSAPFPAFDELAGAFMRIEALFGAPQDIEWCVSKNRWWILQSRPITTRTKEMNAADDALERLLPHGDFMFEKTGLSEIAPRPCPLTLDLLRAIYSTHGPVDRAYRAIGVTYHPEDILRTIGNQLYVDRDAEVRSLLPSFGRSGRPGYAPGPVRMRGFLQSMRNSARLAALRVPDSKELMDRIRLLLLTPKIDLTLEASVSEFLSTYQEIFTVNLFAERASVELAAAIRAWGGSVAALLSGDAGESKILRPPDGLIGNGIDLADHSAFRWETAAAGSAVCEQEIARAPEKARARIHALSATARAYARLREYGRWATVRLTNQIRASAFSVAKAAGWKNPAEILFASLQEVRNGHPNELRCAQRRKEWEHWNRWTFPTRLTGRVEEERKNVEGLSAGVAVGIVIDRKQLGNMPDKAILWTNELTPDLVDLFDNLAGIIAARGGLLSHCAIVARERGIPVSIDSSGRSYIGRKVRMNGATGHTDVME